MRVVIGEFKNESNTFAAVPTTLEHFRSMHLFYGQALIERLRDTNTEISGFLDVLDEAGYTAIPTLAGFAISGAPMSADTFALLRDDLLERIDQSRPFDGVLLALHGATVVEGEPDASGALIAHVRQLIGDDVPLVISMDLHANITRRCVQHADAIVGFRTCPHIDQRDTGRRAAHILVSRLRGDTRPVMHYVKVPMVVPASTHIHDQPGPFKRLMDATQQIEGGKVLSASAFTVQPWLDIPEMGFAMICVTDGDHRLANQVACDLASQSWADRNAFMDIQLMPPPQAIAEALASSTGPVVLSDLADGTGAGSAGDSTAVIEALLFADPHKTALIYLFDPEAAAEAARIGIGGQFDAFVGAKRDAVYNHPVRFSGTVRYAQASEFRFGGNGYTGITMDMGLSAVIQHNNIHLLITSNSVMTVDPALYRAAGLEPAEAQIIVVKSHIQFRAGYEGLATRIILLDSPGMSSDHLTSFDWKHVDRPLFPLDTDFNFSPYLGGDALSMI